MIKGKRKKGKRSKKETKGGIREKKKLGEILRKNLIYLYHPICTVLGGNNMILKKGGGGKKIIFWENIYPYLKILGTLLQTLETLFLGVLPVLLTIEFIIIVHNEKFIHSFVYFNIHNTWWYILCNVCI